MQFLPEILLKCLDFSGKTSTTTSFEVLNFFRGKISGFTGTKIVYFNKIDNITGKGDNFDVDLLQNY